MAAGAPVTSMATEPQKHDPTCFSDILILLDNADTPGALVTGVTAASGGGDYGQLWNFQQ
jgi:hypothetical protein